jgi:GntR family transcriptional regulator
MSETTIFQARSTRNRPLFCCVSEKRAAFRELKSGWRKNALDKLPYMRHSTHVTVLRFNLRPGQSIFDQVVFASVKAFLSGEFEPGQAFPSVRTLAADLRIHPNTAHKVIQHLIQERWLEARPGIGTVVAATPPARAGDRRRLLQQEVEQLVVEAKRVGLELEDIVAAIEGQWEKLERPVEVGRG